MSDYTPTTDDIQRLVYEYGPSSAVKITWEDFNAWLAEVKAQAIGDAIAYLKSTPAVTLTGKGGGYELLDAYRQGENK